MRPGFLSLFFVAATASSATFELASPVIAASPVTPNEVRIAATPTESLVIWDASLGHTVKAMRVSATGAPMDERDLTIASSVGLHGMAVATDGRDYLVAYGDCADGARSDCVTRFVTVTADGFVLPSPQMIRNGVPYDIAWGNGAFVVSVHIPQGEGSAGRIAIVERYGVVRGEAMLPGPPANEIAVTRAANGVALLWRAEDQLWFAEGTVDSILQGAVVPRAVMQSRDFVPRIAATSDGFVASVFRGDSSVSLATVLALDRRGAMTGRFSWVSSSSRPVGATASSRFFLDVTRDYDLELRRITDGGKTDGAPVRLTTDTSMMSGKGAAVTSLADGSAVLAWVTDHQLRVARITGSGEILRGAGFAGAPNVARDFVRHEQPVVRRCGDVLIAAWIESSDVGSVRYRRFTADGVPLDPPSRRATAPTRGHQVGPDIACTGDTILLVWTETSPTMRVSARGLLIGRGAIEPRVIELGDVSGAVVAATSGEYAVFGWRGLSLRASRWTAGGERLTEPVELFTEQSCGEGEIAVDGAGQRYLLLTRERCDEVPERVVARPLTQDLRPIGAPLRFDAFDRGSSDVVASPEGWLLAWSAGRVFGESAEIEGTAVRLTRDFEPLDPPGGIHFARERGEGLAAAWNGRAYEVMMPERAYEIGPGGTIRELTKRPAPDAATDGPGLRLFVRIEAVDPNATRVVGELDPE